MNILSTTELYNLNGWNVLYMNWVSSYKNPCYVLPNYNICNLCLVWLIKLHLHNHKDFNGMQLGDCVRLTARHTGTQRSYLLVFRTWITGPNTVFCHRAVKTSMAIMALTALFSKMYIIIAFSFWVYFKSSEIWM